MWLIVFFFAIMAWAIYQENRKNPIKEVPPPPRRLADWQVATAQTVNWQECFKDFCESPAEVGFLTAMISSYQLIPDRGTLKGGGLELQLQIPIGHYRVDFLANKYLVVEIDGATYHSSPEAVESDRIRDQFLTQCEYVVLRIPAKIVFNSPSEAVRRVRCSISNLTHERSIRAQEAARGVQKPNPPRTNFFSDVGKALQDGSNWMDRSLALQKSKETFDKIFRLEVHLIESSLELARSKIKVDSWRRSSPEANQLYLESLRQLEEASGPTRSSYSLITIPPLTPPDLDSEPEYSTAKKAMHAQLMKERLQHFDGIRKTLEKDSELAEYVKKQLEALVENSHDLWHLIAPEYGGLSGADLGSNQGAVITRHSTRSAE